MTISSRLTLPGPVPVRMDAADPQVLSRVAPGEASDRSKFWSSTQRDINSTVEEVVEVSLNSPRRVNLLTFEISRFPLTMRAEYLDSDGVWRAFQYDHAEIGLGTPQPVRERTFTEVGLSIAESVPPKVDSAARGDVHPQHFGINHWRREEWKTNPVVAEKVRFILRRNPLGTGPVNPQGRRVTYSLAMRQIKIGYRVASERDIPPGASEEDWESSRDFLGGLVTYSLYRQAAAKVIDGDEGTSWRSAPQPVNYAVVPLYLDMRDENGVGQTIDKFFVDPVTSGVHCNLYYSDEEPVGDFLGDSRPVPSEHREEQGVAVAKADRILLGGDAPSGIGVSNLFAGIQTERDWWVAIDAVATLSADEPGNHPIVSVGPHQVTQSGGALKFIAQSGEEAEIVLPAYHVVGAEFRLIVQHAGAGGGLDERIILTYQAVGYEVLTDQVAVVLPPMSASIRVGLHPDPDSTEVSGIGIRGLVAKTSALSPEALDWFLTEGEEYVRDDQRVVQQARNANRNAVLRMHPDFVTESNAFGVVGGDVDRLRNCVWHPVGRDYILHRGYMEFTPIRARYWKFEFTQLSPRIFETFQIIERTILCFPPSVVSDYSVVGPQHNRNFYPHGVSTMVHNRTSTDFYADAVSALRLSGAGGAGPEVAQALVVKEPHLAEQAAETGWIWQFQPWHAGDTSPRWHEPGRHFYEQIPIRHATKVAYFVGVKEITPFRTEYSQPDDTEEYVERFWDTHMIDSMVDIDLREAGGALALTKSAEVVSKTHASYLNLRGLQFATLETGMIQVFDDPDFLNPNLDVNWDTYGDATVTRVDTNFVEVERGWAGRWYSDLEAFTYGELEAFTYAELEGRDLDSDPGFAEGGVQSKKPYQPMGPGRVVAKVKVSTKRPLSAPITVDLLSAQGDALLATSEKVVPPGGVTTITAEFPGYSITDWHTYAEVEQLSGDPDDEGIDAVEENEIGPGSTVQGSPTPITPHKLSTTTGFISGSGPGGMGALYYDFTPTESGTFSIDVLLSTLDDGTTPTGFAVFATPIGMDNLTYLDTAAGRTHAVGDVEAGRRVTIQIIANVWDGAVWTSPPTTVRLRTSEIGDTTLWTPDTTVLEPEATYEMLEQYTWAELESAGGLSSKVLVRVRQVGESRDTFRVHRIALYDEPVVWSFSVDDGTTWQQAFGVKNDPYAALVFPTPGNLLRWKAQIFREDCSVSSIHIRPWYGGTPEHQPAFFDLEQTGPNQSGWDLNPTLPQHPMWKPLSDVEFEKEPPPPPIPFWRNLVPNPSAEGIYIDQWTVTSEDAAMERVDSPLSEFGEKVWQFGVPPEPLTTYTTVGTSSASASYSAPTTQISLPGATLEGDLIVLALSGGYDTGLAESSDPRMNLIGESSVWGRPVRFYAGYADATLDPVEILLQGVYSTTGQFTRAGLAVVRGVEGPIEYDPARTAVVPASGGNSGELPGLSGTGSGAIGIIVTSGGIGGAYGWSWQAPLYSPMLRTGSYTEVSIARSNSSFIPPQTSPSPYDWCGAVIGLK